jgi:hypothetical protein
VLLGGPLEVATSAMFALQVRGVSPAAVVGWSALAHPVAQALSKGENPLDAFAEYGPPPPRQAVLPEEVRARDGHSPSGRD